jgi:hypothetical protein
VEPVFGEPLTLGPGRGGSPLAPVWQAETSLYLSDPLVTVPELGALAVTLPGFVTALDARSGKTIWTRSFQGRRMHAAVAGRVVIICGAHPSVFGLSAAAGSVLWERQFGGEASMPGVALANGKVAMALHAGGGTAQVLVLRPENGEVVWQARLDGASRKRMGSSSAPVLGLHAAGSSLLVAVGEMLYSFDAAAGAVLARHAFEPLQRGRETWIASVDEMASVGPRVFVLLGSAVKTMSQPELHDPEDLISFQDFTGIERFARPLGPRFMALGTPLTRDGAVLTVVEGDSLQTRYAIEVEASPSPPVDLGDGRWACLLQPLRDRRDQEAALLVVETETGKALHREPLGSRGWYEGHVAASGSILFVTCAIRGAPERAWGVRAYELAKG